MVALVARPPARVARWVGLALLLWAGAAAAHAVTETRRAVLEVGATATRLVLHWTLPDGVAAEQLRRRLDGDGDLRMRRPWERLALGQVLLPKVQRGLSLWVAGRQIAVRLADVQVKDRPWQGRRTGFEVLALFEGPAAAPGEAVALAWQAGPDTVLEAQGGPGREVVGEGWPHRPGDPVWGPVTLNPARLQATVTARAAGTAQGAPSPRPAAQPSSAATSPSASAP